MSGTAPARTGNPVGRWFADRKVGAKILVAVLSAATVAVTVGGVGTLRNPVVAR